MPGLLDYMAPLFQSAGQQNNIDPKTLAAIAATETGGTFNPSLTSGAGAMGLMQLMPQTARSLNVSDPYDPAQAVPAAAQGFAQLLAGQERKVGPGWSALSRALMSYNNGPNPARWNNPQTQSYPGAFLRYYQRLPAIPPVAEPQPSVPPINGAAAAGGLLAMAAPDYQSGVG